MPTNQVVKSAESWGPSAREMSHPISGDSGWRRPMARADDLEKFLGEFARRILVWEASDREGAAVYAMDVFARGMTADRVTFFLADPSGLNHADPCNGGDHGDTKIPTRFESLVDWCRPGVLGAGSFTSVATSMDLEYLPEQRARLRAGEVLDLAEMEFSADAIGAQNVFHKTSWSRSRTVLLIPCLSPEGLLGFFRIEGGLAAARWSASQREKAALIASFFAGFLERHRLTSRLSTSAAQASTPMSQHDEQLQTLGRVASSVAHDFNNVLTAILGYADLAEMELPEDAPGQSEIAEIRDAATRAADLVEQVLSQARRGGTPAEPVNLCTEITKLEGMLRRVLGEGIDLELNLNPSLDRVAVDPRRLERALLNLASNAKDAISKGSSSDGRFSLSTEMVEIDADGFDSADLSSRPARISELSCGRYQRLSVHDDGCGIDLHDQGRIFESFFTTRAKGTGLGLATVAEVMHDVKGAVRVESALGEGSSFHLYFPI